MFIAVKKGITLKACRLGEPSPLLERLLAEKRVVPTGAGEYQVFSRETDAARGEIAHDGDFVKLDAGGEVYPNKADFFLEKHDRLGENTYRQKEQRLPAWDAGEPMCEEVAFLIGHKGLVLDPESRDRYFSAPLWGTLLHAARDAVIVFYSISRDEDGRVTDADFNFVDRELFEKTYRREDEEQP